MVVVQPMSRVEDFLNYIGGGHYLKVFSVREKLWFVLLVLYRFDHKVLASVPSLQPCQNIQQGLD